MTFATPALLGLLPLALAPILVHLLYKRRRATIEFPSLRLLRNVELRLSPRRRLREILLLAARCLFVAMLVFAVARPVSSGSTGSSSTPVDYVLVVDDTASTRLSDGAATAFEIAKRRVAETLDALGGRDRAALLPMVEPDGWDAGALTNDRARLRAALDSLAATDAGADVVQVVDHALEVADASSAARREVLVFSDFRGPTGPVADGLARALGGRSGRTGVLLVDCATPCEKPNVALSLADVDPPAPLVGRPVEVVAELANGSDDELVRGVTLEVAGAVLETRSVTVPAAGRVFVRLRVPGAGQVGWTHGRLTLSADAFAGDNAAAFVMRVRDRLRVLVVDPALEATVPDPEASGRFLARLLDPSGDGSASGIEVRRVRPADVRGGLPDDVHAVFVCGWAAAETVGAGALERFARGGGLVGILAADEDADPGPSFAWMAARPRGQVEAVDPPGGVRWVREEDEGAASLADLTVLRRLRLGAREDAEVLLAFSDGAPALAVGRVGDGHALAAGFSLAPAWGGFTFHPQVVALLHRLVARYAAPPRIVRARAGEVCRVPADGAGTARLVKDGVALREVAPTAAGVERVYDLGRVLEAGVYAFDVETTAGEDVQRFVAVNPDPGESELGRPAPEVLARAWDGARVVGADEELGPVLASRRSGADYTGAFLLLALAFALAEALLGNRRPAKKVAAPATGAEKAAEVVRRRRRASAGKGETA